MGELQPGTALEDDAALPGFACCASKMLCHPIDACEMGNTPFAVVNSTLKEHGLRMSRAVDASIMPTPISGSTHPATPTRRRS
ncbi:MAG: hypothetical protein LBI92_11180 [Azoarcus sp.]|jgi:choline dehydrogenase|nr:hypothetical protein [Azoarcus sp.]